jgi:hypothetical protein
MPEKSPKPTAKRRDFLKLAGLAPVAGAAALAKERPAEAAAPEPQKRGYRESEHIRKYYDTARF